MRKLDFSTTLTDSQSYIGEQALQYILAAFLQNKTADTPGVNIVQDIKKSAFIAKLTGTNLVQVGNNCSFSDSGTLVAGEAELIPKTMFINTSLCYNELEALWNAVDSANANTQDITADFNNALIGVLTDAMNRSFENAIWNGVSGNGSTEILLFDGIDAQITTYALTGSTFTKSNIVSEVDRLIATLPEAVLEHSDELVIWMNNKSVLYYKQALMALGINTPAEAQLTTYDGIQIKTIGRIADNKMYAFIPSNLAIGVGAMDNFSQLQVLDMRTRTGDNDVRMVLQGKVDVKLIYEAEASSLG